MSGQHQVLPITTRLVEGVSVAECTVPEVDRSPIVFVHGGCHGSWQWAATQQKFASFGRSSTALDWFNHGESQEFPTGKWLERGISSVGEEIGIAVNSLLSKPILVGHSMGGLACASYAANAVSSLRALVLLMPVVSAQFRGETLKLDVDFEKPWGPPPPDVARRMFYSSIEDEAEATRIYSHLQPESPRAVWEATRFVNEVDVDRIEVPVLIMAGELDFVTAPEPISKMAAAMNATLMIIDACGHGVTFDGRWPDFCERIEEWLSAELGE